MSGSSSSQQQQSTSNPVTNQQALAANTANVAQAQGVASGLGVPYTGLLSAPLSANQALGIGAAANAGNIGAAPLNSAIQTNTGLSNFAAPTVNASGYNPALISSAPQATSADSSGLIGTFQNPYTQDVVNATMNELNLQNQQALNANNENATGQGAFGGNRQGVADALTNNLFANTAASTLAGLNSAGYNSALSAAQNQAAQNTQNSQFNTGLTASLLGQNQAAANTAGAFNAGNVQQASLANQAANLAGAGIQQNAANSLQNASAQQISNFSNYLTNLMNTGAIDQQTVQNNLTNLYNQFLQQQQSKIAGQTLVNQSLGLVPVNLGQTSQSTGSGSANSFGLPLGSGGILGGNSLLSLVP